MNDTLSVDDLIGILFNIRLSLRGTEYNAITQVIDILLSPSDVTLAKKILYMIEKNGASIDDLRNFCETFIKAKEDE